MYLGSWHQECVQVNRTFITNTSIQSVTVRTFLYHKETLLQLLCFLKLFLEFTLWHFFSVTRSLLYWQSLFLKLFSEFILCHFSRSLLYNQSFPGVSFTSALVRQLCHLNRGDGELVLLLGMLILKHTKMMTLKYY